MTWRGHTRGLGQPMQLIAGPSRMIRAYSSADLSKHIVFIRRSLAEGKTTVEIAAHIECTPCKLRYFMKKMGLKRARQRSEIFPECDNVSFQSYRPRQKRVSA